MMMEGTKDMTPEQLEEAIQLLGARINVTLSSEYITITANCLSRNYDAVLALVEKILLEPRWDVNEFERLKQAALNNITQLEANPGAIANNVFSRMLYGDSHILSKPGIGTLETVQNITIDDLKSYYSKAFSASVSNFHIAGDITPDKVKSSLKNLETKWKAFDVSIAKYDLPAPASNPALYFIDVPNAKQSVIFAGALTVSRNNPDYFPINFVNYKLGEGSGAQLFQVLRLQKGYTYGAYSELLPQIGSSPFVAHSNVQSSFTLESVKLFHDIMASYGANYSNEELEITRNAMIRSNAGKFETIGSLIGMLHDISTYNLPLDYVKKEEQIAENITLDEAKKIYHKYVQPDKMVYIVVGDARTQFERMKDSGLGTPVMLDKKGNMIKI
jgi:zinc protease